MIDLLHCSYGILLILLTSSAWKYDLLTTSFILYLCLCLPSALSHTISRVTFPFTSATSLFRAADYIPGTLKARSKTIFQSNIFQFNSIIMQMYGLKFIDVTVPEKRLEDHSDVPCSWFTHKFHFTTFNKVVMSTTWKMGERVLNTT